MILSLAEDPSFADDYDSDGELDEDEDGVDEDDDEDEDDSEDGAGLGSRGVAEDGLDVSNTLDEVHVVAPGRGAGGEANHIAEVARETAGWELTERNSEQVRDSAGLGWSAAAGPPRRSRLVHCNSS